MKKLLILLIWLIGLAFIAWLCLRGQSASGPGVATTESATTTTIAQTPSTSATPGATATAETVPGATGTTPTAAAGLPAVASPPVAEAATSAAPVAPASETASAPARTISADAAAAGAKIDEVLKSKLVEFNSSRAVLTAAGQATVAEIATILKDHPKLKVEVRGHTDSTGPEEINHTISHARADVVKSVLMSQGVEGQRITPTGYGSSQPVADNGTAHGRARNRRIAFHVEENN